jgi:hypothetical protein
VVNVETDTKPNNQTTADVDHQPLIDLFALLLEWDMKDVQEKEERRKEVS